MQLRNICWKLTIALSAFVVCPPAQAAVNGQLQGWLNLTAQWGGTAQPSNSKYAEGDTLPLRFTASLAPGTRHTLVLKYDFSSGGAQRFFDRLGSYDATIKTSNLLLGVSNPGVSSQVPIPADLSLPVNAQGSGVLTLYNIDASTVTFGSFSLVNGVKVLPLAFTVASGGTANKTVVVGYGGHLAAENVWGVGNGASQFPGASRKAFASLDGASDVNVSINPGVIVASANLLVTSFVAAPEPVDTGGQLNLTLTVRNNGPDAAASVQVKETLPRGLTFVSATTSQGTFSGTSSLVFSLGTLASGASATMTIRGNVTAQIGTTLTTTATVSSKTFDPDTSNNIASVNSNVRDTTPPAIFCPSDLVRETDPGVCGAIALFEVTATDNHGVVSVTCSPPSGSLFPPGTTLVNCIATDPAGNTATCSFNVTVTDKSPPLISTPGPVTASAGLTTCTAIVNFNVAVSDNCPGATVVCTPASGSSFPIGTTTVQCQATDLAGNVSTTSFTVTVVDNQAPIITCPGDQVAEFGATGCTLASAFVCPTATDNCDASVTVTCDPPASALLPLGTTLVTCTATDAAGNTAVCTFNVTVLDGSNQSWPQALLLELQDPEGTGTAAAAVQQCLTIQDQSRWYKFKVHPGSRVVVTLTDLAENFDLVLFKDIAAEYIQLTSLSDLVHLNAAFAADAFAPAAFSSDAFSPGAFAPGAFAPGAFAPGAFAPGAFAPGAFAPGAFAPGAFAPDAYAPGAFAPGAFAPGAFAPGAFAPGAFAPGAFAPGAFAAAQLVSVLAVSAFEGIANEGIIANTWDSTGDFYVRVRGRNGVFSPDKPFTVTVYEAQGSCGNVTDSPGTLVGQPLAGSAGGYKTAILTDLDRWFGTDAAGKAAASAKLSELAAVVNGVVIDVSADPVVRFFNEQADQNFDCPFAKNLVARSIKAVIDRYWTLNPLEYVVLVGNDSVLPFVRYPDEALLGPERNYVPPVEDFTASQASLRLNYVLGQDAYGSRCGLALKTSDLPLPDLAVGRLVETPGEVAGMIDSFLLSGGTIRPASTLVTGYDFLADTATAVQTEFAAGLGGSGADALISAAELAPAECWTADDLRANLFGERHDVIFLAGHFSAVGALAADYVTSILASEFEASPQDFANSLIFSAGCHSGYNIVDADSILYVTLAPDWAQACARKRATLIAGTGYQYGDTEFIEYSERLYLEFSKQLRMGPGPISIGKALGKAKRTYLAATPQMRAIHAKSYVQATLFGLPMLTVDFPGQRRTSDPVSPVNPPLTVASDPGLTLGLSASDLSLLPVLTPTDIVLKDPTDGTQIVATFIAGGDGVINNPAEPILPLDVRSVGVAGTVLRGVGFRGAIYSEVPNKIPLTGAAATEIRGVHASFLTEVLYPIRPWSVNYSDALCRDGNGETRLMVIPAQFVSDGPNALTGTFRQFSQMDFRLYYSANITTYTYKDGNTGTPALASPPAISAVRGVTNPDEDTVSLQAQITGDPAAGIQGVWVTFTALSGPYYGKWQSLDLVQDPNDSTLWTGALALNGTFSGDIRFLVQAVNGVGLVALDTKLGAYHYPDEFDSGSTAQLSPTTVEFVAAPASGTFGTTVGFQAQLKDSSSAALGGQRLVFKLGDQEVWGTTDAQGIATAVLPLLSVPGQYAVKVSFPGQTGIAPSFATTPFTLNRQSTTLTIAPKIVYVRPNADPGVIATLIDGAGNRMFERTVLFVVTGPAAYAVPVITDASGRARLGPVPLGPGTYTVIAYFNGTIPLPGGQVTVDDGRYLPSDTSGALNVVTLVVDDRPPTLTCPAAILEGTAPGQCSAVVQFAPLVSDDNPGVTLVCTPPSGSVFAKGTTIVNCVATDLAGNLSQCSFPVTVQDLESPVIVCPENITVPTDPDKATAQVAFSATALDNCDGVLIPSTSVASGSAFTIGTTTVVCQAVDAAGNISTCTFTVTVRDAQGPVISSITATPNILRPPNHQMVPVTITVVAADNAGGAVTATIVQVTSTDPINGTGDGDQSPDWEITGPLTLNLRAERASSGTGRTYNITVRCTDSSGNTTDGTVTVSVPASAS